MVRDEKIIQDCRKLVELMPKRVEQLIKSKGCHIAHRRTGRHFAGDGAEKICPESNFFSLIRMGPETSCKSVLYG